MPVIFIKTKPSPIEILATKFNKYIAPISN